jgi:hypothetical protein
MMETKEQIRQRIDVYEELCNMGFLNNDQMGIIGEWIFILDLVLNS